MKKLAETPRAKFEFWIQEKWEVLPTDPRFIDLTEEQLELLFAHYQRLNAPTNTTAARDEDYPDGQTDDPNLNKQKYIDPDFDEEWEKMEAVDEDIDTSTEEWKEVE